MRPRALMQNLQSDLTGLLDRYHTLASDIITKEGNRPWYPLITCTKDTSSECVLLCFLLFSVTGSADVVHFVCLLYFIYLLEGEGAGGGVCACCTLLLQLRIVTLHWNQTNLIYISYIYITIHLKKVSILMNLKIPCTSCSDWQLSMMLIACFIALLLMLLLAKVKVDVFRVWPFSL